MRTEKEVNAQLADRMRETAHGYGDVNDLILRGDALNAIRKACIHERLPFDSATAEGQRAMEALQAVWKVPGVGHADER